MSDDYWDQVLDDHKHWQHQDWDRADASRRATENQIEARRAFRSGDLAWTAHKMGMTDMAISIARGDYSSSEESVTETYVQERIRTAEREMGRGEYFRAQLELNNYAEQNYPHPKLHYLHGICLQRQKKYAEAVQSFQNAAHFGAPMAFAAMFAANCLIEMNNFATAERWIDEGLVSGDVDADIESELYFLLGKSRTLNDDHEGAVAAFERAASLSPQDGWIFSWLGGALVRLKRPLDALKALEKAEVGGVPPDAIAFRRALAYIDCGDLKAAERHLDIVITKEPDWDGAAALRGDVHARGKRWNQAIADYSRCIQLKPKRMGYYIDRGLCRRENNELNAALDDFNTAEQLGPKSPRPPFYRADCLLRMGRVREAQEAVARSLELGPGHEGALRLRERCWKA